MDPIYFSGDPWEKRVEHWIAGAGSFAASNAGVISTLASSADHGLIVVVNVSANTLLRLLEGERYLNVYNLKKIGGEGAPDPEARRVQVDDALELHGPNVYFGALALAGTGVRYYGDYCLVIDPTDFSERRLFDRDSYDITEEPLSAWPSAVVGYLKGDWAERVAMVQLKVLPQIADDHRRVTEGLVAAAVLDDQEFIEVHLLTDGHEDGGFGYESITQVRVPADDEVVAARLRERFAADGLLTPEELKLIRDREKVEARIEERLRVDRASAPLRVVGQYGRGD